MNRQTTLETPQSSWTAAEAVRRLEARGAEIAVIAIHGESAESLSAADLAVRCRGAARTLAEAGIGAGDVVAVYAENGVDWIAAGLGCGLLGAVLAPLDRLMDPAAACEAALAVGAGLLLTDQEIGDPRLRESPIGAVAVAVEGPDAPPVDPGPEAPIAAYRTSGTTGTPKVFTLSTENLGFNVSQTAAAGLVTAGDRVLMPLPMHHVFPWIVGTLVPLATGATVVLPQGMTGPEISRALKLGRPTVVVGVPKLYEALLGAILARLGARGTWVVDALARFERATGLGLGRWLLGPVRRKVAEDLRLLVSGGAKLDPASRARLETLGWDVRCGYGLSETAAIFTGELYARSPGTEGKPLPGCVVRIEAPNEAGVGEVLLRGPNVFNGYLNNPTENARAFDADGYFRTGDLGHLDADGQLIITGRSKEVIVLGAGDNLYPEDLEKHYEKAVDIAEIAVLEHEGKLVALVVPDMAVIRARGAVEPDTAVRVSLATVAKSLPSTQHLAAYRLWSEALPRTRLGKLRRFMLPELYERAASPATAAKTPLTEAERAWIGQAPRQAVWAMLTRDRPEEEVGLDSNMALGLGFDSFGWMSLALEIEEETGVRLEAEDIAGIATVRDLLETVTRLQSERRKFDPALVQTKLDAAIARWLAPQTGWERAVGTATVATIAGVMRLGMRVEVRGVEHIPTDGPALICPNHTSYLDPLIVSTALPFAQHARTYWAADEVIVFQSPVYRHFTRPFRVFPADKHVPEVTMGLAIETLRRGNLQVWFPEGWRSADGRLLPFQPGIGVVVARSGAPVIPTVIEGAVEVWPREKRFPKLFRKLRITFYPKVEAQTLIERAGGSGVPPSAIATALHEITAEHMA